MAEEMKWSARQQAEIALKSLTDCCGLLASLSGSAERGAGWEAWRVPGTFWYNRARLLPLEGRTAEMAAAEIAGPAKAGRVPPLVCWLEQDFPGGDLGRAMLAAGFVPVTDQTAMFLSLEGRRPGPGTAQAEDMPPETAEHWAAVNARAFGKPADTGAMKLLAERGGNAVRFLQRKEAGEVASGAMLCALEGCGGIHEVFTLQEFRGRGWASGLVNRLLDMAAASGCDCAALQASALGAPVYRALGFQDVGVIHNYVLPPEK